MSDIFDPLEPSPYKVLNVSQDATTQQIRTAHRKLVLVFHPDKVQNESEKAAKTERFQEIQHAYEILQDEKRRLRWDKRAADRDRQMEERRMPRKASAYTPSRSAQAPVFENRDGVIYEERVPRYARTFEENTFDAAFASGPSKSSKKWDDTYEDASSRRTSGRGPETRSRYKDVDSEVYAKAQERRKKEETRKARDEADKKRDKAKRQDKEASFTRRAHVDDLDDTDDYDDRHYSSKSDSKSKRKTTESKRYKDDPPRRSSKKDTRDGDSDLDRKIYTVHDYIGKSNNTEPEKKRPSRGRADSYSSRTQLPTPPPTPRDRDSGRRSSGDDGRKSSARARRPPSPARRNTHRNIDIVDPPSTKSRNASGTAERTLPREKTMPTRSRTAYNEPLDFQKPSLKRAETMPVPRMAATSDHRKAPIPKAGYFDVSETSDDSVSSSDSDAGTEVRKSKLPPSSKRPPPQPTPMRYSSYKVTMDDERSNIVTEEPQSYEDRSRDNSPKNLPRRSATDRYASATSTRSPLAHSSTFHGRPTPHHSESSSSRHMPPSLRTTQSARNHPELFGAIDNDLPSPRNVSSPKAFPDPRLRSGRDSATHSRRGSEDVHADYSPRNRRMDSRRGHSSREIPAR